MLQFELKLYRFSLLLCHVCVKEFVNSVDCGMWDLQVQGIGDCNAFVMAHVGEAFECERNNTRKKPKGHFYGPFHVLLISLMIQIL